MSNQTVFKLWTRQQKRSFNRRRRQFAANRTFARCHRVLDHLICTDNERLRNRNTERLGGPAVDEQFQFGLFLNWKIGRVRALEYPVHVLCSAPQYALTQLVRVPAQRGAHRRSVMNLVDTTRAVFVGLPRRGVPNARAQASLEQLTHAR